SLSHAPFTFHSFPTRRSSDLVLPEQVRIRSPISQQFYQRQTPGVRGNVKCRGSWRRRIYSHVADRAGGWISGLPVWVGAVRINPDRKSTRLNSSHSQISYAVF